jgi:isochorismate hydrolase
MLRCGVTTIWHDYFYKWRKKMNELEEKIKKNIDKLKEISKENEKKICSSDSEWMQDDNDQSWFWTDEWQAGEKEATADMKAGRYTECNSIEEVHEFLDSLKKGEK